eukprot:2428203-Amphidinium_carterae.1
MSVGSGRVVKAVPRLLAFGTCLCVLCQWVLLKCSLNCWCVLGDSRVSALEVHGELVVPIGHAAFCMAPFTAFVDNGD